MLAFVCSISEHIPMTHDEIPKRLFVPNVIDIEVTGNCEFNCPGCWGSKPSHDNKELTTKQWLKIFEKIDDYSFFDSNERVVITGGEPLLRNDLIEIIDGLSGNDRQISLSTTGLDRHNLLKRAIGKLSTIGIPIDGSSPEINSSWRRHNIMPDGGLNTSLDALRLIQENTPDLYTSVRTLVHHENVNKIAEIPEFLTKSGIDIARLRWILYELNERKITPNKFPRLVSTKATEYFAAGSNDFEPSMEYSGRGFQEVVVRTIGKMAYRNFIINPSGETRAIVPSSSCDESIEIEFGNLHKDFRNTMKSFNDSEEKYFFSWDAADSPEGFYIRQDMGLMDI